MGKVSELTSFAAHNHLSKLLLLWNTESCHKNGIFERRKKAVNIHSRLMKVYGKAGLAVNIVNDQRHENRETYR